MDGPVLTLLKKDTVHAHENMTLLLCLYWHLTQPYFSQTRNHQRGFPGHFEQIWCKVELLSGENEVLGDQQSGALVTAGLLRNSGLARHLEFRHLLQMCFFEMKRATGGASKLVKARQWDEFPLSDQDRSVTINWWSEQGGLVLVDISFISFFFAKRKWSHIIWLHCHCSEICCAQRSEKLQDSWNDFKIYSISLVN